MADIINQNKDNFYDKYDYLKPECEKDWLEKAGDWLVSATDWCKENWESICNVILGVLIVVTAIVSCVLTFGASAVILAAAIGAAVGFASQLVSDIISWSITGEWDGNWQSYLGASLGGAVGGALILTGNPVAACAADGAISTFMGENLENITGGTKRSNSEIWADTFLSAGTAAIFSKAFDKITGKFLKRSAALVPGLRRLAGPGSYSAAYKMILTKLTKGQIKHISTKTIRNGVVSGLMGDVLKNITNGIFDGIEKLYGQQKQPPQIKYAQQ